MRIALQVFLTVIMFVEIVFAATEDLCRNLSRFSCAPGEYDDGTGKIKSEDEVQANLV